MTKLKIDVLGKKAPRPNKHGPKVSERITATQSERSLSRTVAGLIWFLVKPRRPTWALGALAFVVVSFGTPHLLVWDNRMGKKLQVRVVTSAAISGDKVCGATCGQTGIVP
ncbi:hypothetical protein [Phaeovulum sp.]|uniref:hypothetical protein n=1 Tax=Phaeovulum sp. TaxID=2934796 RepID=UPI0039E587EE